MQTFFKIENQKSPAFSEVGLKYLLQDIARAKMQGSLVVDAPSLSLASWHLLKAMDSPKFGQPVAIYGTVDNTWYKICASESLKATGQRNHDFIFYVEDMVLATRLALQAAAGALRLRKTTSGDLEFNVPQYGDSYVS